MTTRNRECGSITGGTIAIALMGVGLVLLGALSVWLYMNYHEQKTNVDGRVSAAVATAKRDQASADDDKFTKREKEPNRQFVGPDDLGRLTFYYPKTWSVYVAEDGSQGKNYAAYLNPVTVPPVGGDSQRFALRVQVQTQDYNSAVNQYDSLVQEGKLKSSTTSANGQTGTRLDGSFSENIRGAVVIYKLRDKTISVFTDANTFLPDFNTIVKTIKFNS